MSEELSDREKQIRARQAAGLSRQQAEAVQTEQEAHDAALAESAPKKQSASPKPAASPAK